MIDPNKTNRTGGTEHGSPELSPNEARQSEKGRGLIYVLAGGLVLAFAVWAVLELFAPKGASPDVETVTEDAEQVAPAAQ
ncbi:hypothetical protein [Martelella soudanensis]|uniref:hypothetical protein n=1 Tax=unclassified Martelella TaxID=2629616 RepID=UPI0015DEAD50|nr:MULTISPECIES: hypothetical protein [unclassified Martelella]